MAFGFPASASRAHHFDADPIIMRRLVCDAFEKLDWRYEVVDREICVAKVPMGMHSYGELLTVSVDEDGKLLARSSCIWPTQLYDWGKNEQNIDQLFLRLISSIRNSALNPREIPSAFDELGRSPVERLLGDKNE